MLETKCMTYYRQIEIIGKTEKNEEVFKIP